MKQESTSNLNNNTNTYQSIENPVSDLHINYVEENMVLDFFLGNMYKIKCTRCGHPTSSHHSIDRTSWRCDECDEESNICSIDPKDTWEDLSAFLERVKNSI